MKKRSEKVYLSNLAFGIREQNDEGDLEITLVCANSDPLRETFRRIEGVCLEAHPIRRVSVFDLSNDYLGFLADEEKNGVEILHDLKNLIGNRNEISICVYSMTKPDAVLKKKVKLLNS